MEGSRIGDAEDDCTDVEPNECELLTVDVVPHFLPRRVGTYSNHGIEPGEENTVQKINQDRGSIEYPFADDFGQALFCVFDGHGPGGDAVAHASMITMHTSLVAKEDLESQPEQALYSAFEDVEAMLNASHDTIDVADSGTTGVAILMRGDELYCGHVGDSRAVIGRKQADSNTLVPFQLTMDHTPADADETKAVNARGGKCLPAFGGWPPRVVMFLEGQMHSMMMTRSLGDSRFKEKGGLSALPEMTHYQLSNEDVCIVLASDGVWEMLSNEEVLSLIEADKIASLDATDVCRAIVDKARHQWEVVEGDYRDDITVTVIFLPCLNNAKTESLSPAAKSPLSVLAARRHQNIYMEDCTPRSSVLSRNRSLSELSEGSGIFDTLEQFLSPQSPKSPSDQGDTSVVAEKPRVEYSGSGSLTAPSVPRPKTAFVEPVDKNSSEAWTSLLTDQGLDGANTADEAVQPEALQAKVSPRASSSQSRRHKRRSSIHFADPIL